MSGDVQFQRVGGAAWVRLHHPGKFNAMNRAMWLSLRTVFQNLQADASVRCIVVSGADGHFCAGGDIAEYPGFRFDAQQLQHFHENEVWGALQAMLDCDVPILASIEGNCMGAGLEIASCCDFRWAADNARFGAPIARLGFPMAPREAVLVMGAVGESAARAMLLGAESWDAPAMQRVGFLGRVCTASDLSAQVQDWVRKMQTLAPGAARMNKRTLRALKHGGIAQVPDPYGYANSAEHREGITAFLEKRPPVFG